MKTGLQEEELSSPLLSSRFGIMKTEVITEERIKNSFLFQASELRRVECLHYGGLSGPLPT